MSKSSAAGPLTYLVVISLLCLLASPLVASDAPSTRSITLRWKHSGVVRHFNVYTRGVFGRWGPARNIGIPKQVSGVFSYEVEVSNLEATYVAVTAVNANGESEPSNGVLFTLPD
jgi:hypothetical protein